MDGTEGPELEGIEGDQLNWMVQWPGVQRMHVGGPEVGRVVGTGSEAPGVTDFTSGKEA